jgi:predicted lipoprotein with Yx(FWY)xxD motif
MKRRDRCSGPARWGVVFVVGALVLSACAKNASTAASSSSAPTSSPTTSASESGMANSSSITTAKVSSVGTVLTNGDGLTVYLLTTENGNKILCTGTCANIWPPVVLPAGTSSATAMSGVNGSLLGTVKLPNGQLEVAYNGHPLHTYSGDSNRGEAFGQGIQGVWFAVTPAGTPAGSSSPGSGGGGGGY